MFSKANTSFILWHVRPAPHSYTRHYRLNLVVIFLINKMFIILTNTVKGSGNILFLASTNLPWSLDPAILRDTNSFS